jgi:phosphocarrier protein
MTSRSVIVVNHLGIHARAAAKFVHLATRFQASVRVARPAREMDGKSIMGILLLAAARGSTITISADGADEREAVEALTALVQSGFGEEATAADRTGRGTASASGGNSATGM